MTLRLSILPQTYAVCRLAPDARLPDWIPWQSPFTTVSRSDEELSIVCPAPAVPEDVTALRDWRAFKVEGPLDFAMTGVMSALTAPLAEAEIGILAISTYDTDYLLVRSADLSGAADVLRRSCEVSEAPQ